MVHKESADPKEDQVSQVKREMKGVKDLLALLVKMAALVQQVFLAPVVSQVHLARKVCVEIRETWGCEVHLALKVNLGNPEEME